MKKLIAIVAFAASASCLADGAEAVTNKVLVTIRGGGTVMARRIDFHALAREHGKRVSVERNGNVVTWGFEDGYKLTLALPKNYALDPAKCAGVHRTDIKRMEAEGKARQNGGAK